MANQAHQPTEQTAANRSFAESEARYQAIVEAFDGLIYVCSRDYRVEFMNRRFVERTGHDGVGELCYRALHNLESVCPWCVNDRVFRGETVRWEVLSPKDNRWFYVVNTPIFHPDGSLSKQALILDVTERKEAERQIRLLGAIVEQASEGIAVVDLDGRVLYANQTWATMHGFPSPEPLRGQHLSIFHSEDQLKREALPFLEAVRQKGHHKAECGHQTREGHAFPTLMTVTQLKDEHGKPYGIVGLAKDITDLKRAEGERLELERRLLQAQKLESLGLMAGGLAHDFNNLLMGVLGNADLALQVLPPRSPARSSLTGIMTAAQRLADLTQQLLAYSGKGRFLQEPVDLARLVGEMTTLLEVSLPTQIALRVDLAANVPPITGDIGQMRQLILNLLTNAAEALSGLSGIVALRVSCPEPEHGDPGERYACLEVSDTGCGMDAQTCERIFDPFFSTKFIGRGLGLAAVSGIVRGHGGRIQVRSTPGQGTCFTVLLPCQDHKSD